MTKRAQNKHHRKGRDDWEHASTVQVLNPTKAVSHTYAAAGFCTVFCGWHNTNANTNAQEFATRPMKCAP